jgi:DHA1 family tetracycline resistance protein-like MFS transporter
MSRPASAPGLGPVYATVFLDLFGFGILLPALPYHAERLGATGLWLGVLFTAYSAAQLVGAAVLGRFSDRIGRRPVLLLSLAGSAASFAASAFAPSLVALAAARALAGLFGGSISTAQAYVADVTRPEDRAPAMGRLGAAIGSGFVAGPAVGALLAAGGHGFRAAALLAAGLAVVNLGAAAVRLREPVRPPDGRPAGDRRLRLTGLGASLRLPVVGPVLMAGFLVMFGFVAMETTLAFLAARRFGTDERGLGGILVFVGVVLIAFQAGLIGPLTRRFGERGVAIAGCVGVALALAGLPFAPGLPQAFVALGALAAGQALANPSLATLLSRAAGVDEQGAVLGLGQSLAAAARAVGPLAAGALYDLAPPAPYLLGAALAVLAALLVRASARR